MFIAKILLAIIEIVLAFVVLLAAAQAGYIATHAETAIHEILAVLYVLVFTVAIGSWGVINAIHKASRSE